MQHIKGGKKWISSSYNGSNSNLATQHLENFDKMLTELGIKSELLISGITKKKKKKFYKAKRWRN